MPFTEAQLRAMMKEEAQDALNAWWNPVNVQGLVEAAVAAQLPAFIAAIPTAQSPPVTVDVGALAKAIVADLARRLQS